MASASAANGIVMVPYYSATNITIGVYASNNSAFGSGYQVCTNLSQMVTLIGGVNYNLLPNASTTAVFQVFDNGYIYGTDVNTLETVVYAYSPLVTA